MGLEHVDIAGDITGTANLSARAGLPLHLADGDLRVGAGVLVEEERLRRLVELSGVAEEPVGRRGRRVEYRMLNGVRREADAHLDGLGLRYELTGLRGRPIGGEAAKTIGHIHLRPPGSTLGFAEIVEVLHGEAGFLIADLAHAPAGPVSRRAWLVRARPGDWVVLPPELAHATIDLGRGPLVFSDIIDRRCRTDYPPVVAAGGFGWYVGADGDLRPNQRYARLPEIEEVSAAEWSGPSGGILYERFREDPATFGWLAEPAHFAGTAPTVWQRISPLLAGERRPDRT